MEIQRKSFTFQFDETTSKQVKKQYYGYIIFFSLESGTVVLAYCGTLFVGRCSAPDRLNHLQTFFTKQFLGITLLLNLEMDNQNVDLAFQNLLINDFEGEP